MRSHYCGHLNTSHIGEEVQLCGWVHRRRDHGGVIFIDLRDREGLVQVVYDPDRPESFAAAEQVRNEYVLRVSGRCAIALREPRIRIWPPARWRFSVWRWTF